MMTDERDKVVMWFEAECKRRGVGVMELLDQIIADNLAPDGDTESDVGGAGDVRSRESGASLASVSPASGPPAGQPQVQECPACGGQGFWMATHYVTRDMASDACEPSMEGMAMEEKVPCDRCGGGGVVEAEPAGDVPAGDLPTPTQEQIDELVAASPSVVPDLLERLKAAEHDLGHVTELMHRHAERADRAEARLVAAPADTHSVDAGAASSHAQEERAAAIDPAPPQSPASPVCVKCRGTDISTTFHKGAGYYDGCGGSVKRRHSMRDGEHLHRTCRTCQWDWCDPPADSAPT